MQTNQMTQKLQEALQSAHSLCEENQQTTIEPGHLLLCFLQDPDGIGQSIISKSGVNASQLEQEINAEISKYPKTSGDTSTVYISHELKRLLKQAFSEARIMKDEFVSVEHVFLAISKNKFCDKAFKSVGLTHAAILNSLKEIGCDSISIDTLNNRVRRERNVQIDFSAIAKGFAIDQVYNELKKNIYITGFFIEVGGEIKTYGLKGKNTPWSVGIAHPEFTSKPIFESKTNTRESFSMATSGDYRNIRILDGKMLSHTINTKNGYPLEVLNSSVSVVNGSAMRADALATAINAMGPTKGLTFANNKNIDAIFILKEEGNYLVKFSESFKKTLQ